MNQPVFFYPTKIIGTCKKKNYQHDHYRSEPTLAFKLYEQGFCDSYNVFFVRENVILFLYR